MQSSHHFLLVFSWSENFCELQYILQCPMTIPSSPTLVANLKNLIYCIAVWWKHQVTNISKPYLCCPVRTQRISFLWAKTPYYPSCLCLGHTWKHYLLSLPKPAKEQPLDCLPQTALHSDTHRVIPRNTSVSVTYKPFPDSAYSWLLAKLNTISKKDRSGRLEPWPEKSTQDLGKHNSDFT